MTQVPKPSTFNPAPLAFKLNHVGRLVGEAMERALEGGDVTLGQGKFLRHLVMRSEGATPAQLAELAGCSRANATQMLARLEASGHVRRRENPEDARSAQVFATAAGRQALDEALATVAAFERRLRRKLGPEGVDRLWSLLERVP